MYLQNDRIILFKYNSPHKIYCILFENTLAFWEMTPQLENSATFAKLCQRLIKGCLRLICININGNNKLGSYAVRSTAIKLLQFYLSLRLLPQ